MIEAAGQLFLAQGFDRTSMDAVADTAGVSKQTVYSHFSDKESLFRAVINAELDAHFGVPAAVGGVGETIPRRLHSLGCQFVRLITSDRGIAMFRMLVARAGDDARQAELFYAAGPAALVGRLQHAIVAAMEAGYLKTADAARAASEFAALLKGDIHFHRALGLPVDLSDAAITAHVERCVQTLAAAYSPSSSSAAMPSAIIGDIK